MRAAFEGLWRRGKGRGCGGRASKGQVLPLTRGMHASTIFWTRRNRIIRIYKHSRCFVGTLKAPDPEGQRYTFGIQSGTSRLPFPSCQALGSQMAKRSNGPAPKIGRYNLFSHSNQNNRDSERFAMARRRFQNDESAFIRTEMTLAVTSWQV